MRVTPASFISSHKDRVALIGIQPRLSRMGPQLCLVPMGGHSSFCSQFSESKADQGCERKRWLCSTLTTQLHACLGVSAPRLEEVPGRKSSPAGLLIPTEGWFCVNKMTAPCPSAHSVSEADLVTCAAALSASAPACVGLTEAPPPGLDTRFLPRLSLTAMEVQVLPALTRCLGCLG